MKKLILPILAVVLLWSCKSKQEEPVLEGRDAFVGEYLLHATGTIDIDINVATFNQEFEYPVDWDSIRVVVSIDDTSEDSVIITFPNDNYEDFNTKGCVVGNRLLLNPTKMDIQLDEMAEEMLGSFAGMVSGYLEGAEMSMYFYHTPAQLADGVVTLTTDCNAELNGTGLSCRASGTISSVATR